jgi:GTPase SAR1 family protein
VRASIRNLQVLAATKCDLSDERVVSQTEGEELGHRYDYPCIECSAKTDVNINLLFETLLRMMTQNDTSEITQKDKKGAKCMLQ